MKKGGDVTKLTKGTRIEAGEPEFSNINDAIDFGNTHINLFNMINSAAVSCRKDVVSDVSLRMDAVKRSDMIAKMKPGNAYALVVKFLDSYSQKIEDFKNTTDLVEKQRIGDELNSMVIAFQDEIREKNSRKSLLRASHSVELYKSLVKVFDDQLDQENLSKHVARMAKAVYKGLKYSLDPSTWRENFKKWSEGEGKETFNVLPKIPMRKALVPHKSLAARAGEAISAAAVTVAATLAENVNKVISVVRSKAPVKRESLSVIASNYSPGFGDTESVGIQFDQEDLLKALEQGENNPSNNNNSSVATEPEPIKGKSFIIERVEEHPLFEDMARYHERERSKKIDPKKTQTRDRKKDIGLEIDKAIEIVFPRKDTLVSYVDAIDSLDKLINKLKKLEIDNQEVLKASELKDILREVIEQVEARVDDYIGLRDKEVREIQMEKAQGKANLHQGFDSRLKKAVVFDEKEMDFNDESPTPKNRFILSNMEIASKFHSKFEAIASDLESSRLTSYAGLFKAQEDYVVAIKQLAQLPRSGLNDKEWQESAKVVQDAHMILERAINVFNQEQEDEKKNLSIDKAIKIPEPINSVNQFITDNTKIYTALCEKFVEEKYKDIEKNAQFNNQYNNLREAYDKYKTAAEALFTNPGNQASIDEIMTAYGALQSAVKAAKMPVTTFLGKNVQPPVQLSELCSEIEKAMLINGQVLKAPFHMGKSSEYALSSGMYEKKIAFMGNCQAIRHSLRNYTVETPNPILKNDPRYKDIMEKFEKYNDAVIAFVDVTDYQQEQAVSNAYQELAVALTGSYRDAPVGLLGMTEPPSLPLIQFRTHFEKAMVAADGKLLVENTNTKDLQKNIERHQSNHPK